MIPFQFKRSVRHQRTCTECGVPFTTMYGQARYCSPECKRKRDNRVRWTRHTRCSECGVDLRRKSL